MATPNESAIRLTAADEAAISKLDHNGLLEYLHNLSVEQNLTTRDAFNPQLLHETELAHAAPKKFGGFITDTATGKKVYVESDSPEGLKIAMAETINGSTTQEQPRDSAGRFVAQKTQEQQDQQQTPQPSDAERAAAQVELELKFKRGQITTDQYLAESGAIDRYLESQGVSMESLRDTSAAAYQRSWADATTAYLQSEAGAGWQGGEENTKIIAELIEANGLQDSPSVETLAQVVQFARENNLLVANPELELQQKLASAKTPQEVNELIGYRRGQNHTESSGFFGR